MRRILFAVALLFGAAAVASAATVRYRTDAELIASSNRVVRGRVLDNVVERAPSGAIRTRTRLAVIEDFTGGADAILTVFERGGHLPDGPTVWIPGAPRFAPGDDVVLCLEQVAGGYRTVSMAFSAFRVGAATAGDRPLTRFGGICAGAEILQIRTVGRRGAGLLGIRPGLVVRGLACLRLERGRALARLGHVRAGSEILDIAVEGRGGVRALGVGPSLLVRVLARLLIERCNARTRLGRMPAGRVALQIGIERRRRASAVRLGPSLVVQGLAGLFVERGDPLARRRSARLGALHDGRLQDRAEATVRPLRGRAGRAGTAPTSRAPPRARSPASRRGRRANRGRCGRSRVAGPAASR